MQEIAGIPKQTGGVRNRVDMGSTDPATLPSNTDLELSKANKAVEDAIAEAERSANPGRNAEGAHLADVPPDVPEPPTGSAGGDSPEAPPAQ
jgi:hypothetical protein